MSQQDSARSQTPSDERVWAVYVTASSKDEAVRLARQVVRERLAACANISAGELSVYEWQGQVCEEAEYYMLLKTRADQLAALQARLVELHSYDTPCVVSWPIECGHETYLQWVRDQSS